MICNRSNKLLRCGLNFNCCSNSANLSNSSIYYSSNYYEDLGISKNSTHGEVKAAYYKLSMLYHPDKNKGSETAAQKFREITQAYEILGNYKLRKLYDKGIIHRVGEQYGRQADDIANEMEPAVEDDPSTKFYKSRFTKSTITDLRGRTPIYNFDEWSRAHYGDSFQRRKAAKTKYEEMVVRHKEHKLTFQNDVLMFSLLIIGVLIYAKYMHASSLDKPKEKNSTSTIADEAKK